MVSPFDDCIVQCMGKLLVKDLIKLHDSLPYRLTGSPTSEGSRRRPTGESDSEDRMRLTPYAICSYNVLFDEASFIGRYLTSWIGTAVRNAGPSRRGASRMSNSGPSSGCLRWAWGPSFIFGSRGRGGPIPRFRGDMRGHPATAPSRGTRAPTRGRLDNPSEPPDSRWTRGPSLGFDGVGASGARPSCRQPHRRALAPLWPGERRSPLHAVRLGHFPLGMGSIARFSLPRESGGSTGWLALLCFVVRAAGSPGAVAGLSPASLRARRSRAG
jgi:hypothetical protein